MGQHQSINHLKVMEETILVITHSKHIIHIQLVRKVTGVTNNILTRWRKKHKKVRLMNLRIHASNVFNLPNIIKTSRNVTGAKHVGLRKAGHQSSICVKRHAGPATNMSHV